MNDANSAADLTGQSLSQTSAEELAELQALSMALASAEQSPWQPRAVARAWATRGAGQLSFTFQRWIDLDAVQSPLLLGELPQTGAQMAEAYDMFGLPIEGASGEEMVLVAQAMQREIADAFGMALAMEPEQPGPDGPEDGFGDWLPTLTALISKVGLGREEALRTPVGAGFQLLAAHRRNEGWKVAGTSYAHRDVQEEPEV